MRTQEERVICPVGTGKIPEDGSQIPENGITIDIGFGCWCMSMKKQPIINSHLAVVGLEALFSEAELTIDEWLSRLSEYNS
ncbi:MAG: hypothetical protein HC918_05715 [Oscillatoriales cyanobacterium SM2_1_8]|nr:hypothetical protein [Oscillatoriales cyanobacterium SM2_1_8]